MLGDKNKMNQRTAEANTVDAFWGKHEATLTNWLGRVDQMELMERLWKKDPSLWSRDAKTQAEIEARLGWLDLPSGMKKEVPGILAFAEEVKAEGFTHILLLGMGGSSLAPELFESLFGGKAGYPRLLVLDSTDPDRIADLEKELDLAKTLFVVSSKSGGTVELLSFFKHFFKKIEGLRPDAGSRFIAITDPGTPLEALAKKSGFRKVFNGPADVGGRFSALSVFGLVPAALIGADIRGILASAEAMAQRTSPDVPARENPALLLGTAMAVLAEEGLDKLTLLTSEKRASFGDWAEQLVAESTGKEDLGVLPVVRENLKSSDECGQDRFFVAVSEGEAPAILKKLQSKGVPYLSYKATAPTEIGGEFFMWELATAIACVLLKVNAFDQPDVQAAKDSTKKILEKGVPAKLAGDDEPALRTFLKEAQEKNYFAILAFLPERPDLRAKLEELREAIRIITKKAVTVGVGPRYLHSTGQLHKGGPDSGAFIFVTADHSADLPVPGEKYTFGQLEAAQALGDLQALRAKERKVFHHHMGSAAASSLDSLIASVKKSLLS